MSKTSPSPSKASKKQERWRLPMRLRFTREGKYFFWISIGVGLAAINTGNNLLYLLLGMMLALIVISGILCNISLTRIRVERIVPTEVYASTPSLMTLEITNNKRFFPSFSIEVEDCLKGEEKGRTAYFLKISPKSSEQTSYRFTLPRRGRYIFEELRVSSAFPFGLFIKTRTLRREDSLVAFPQIKPIPAPLQGSLHRAGWMSSNRKGLGVDFFSLREMQPGDELRWIHWPSTARTGTFQVREFTDEHRPQVDLLLWQCLPSQIERPDESLDPVVELAASLLVLLMKRGHPVRLATATRRFPAIDHTVGISDILYELALLSPLAGNTPPPWIHAFPLVLLAPEAPRPPGVDPSRLFYPKTSS